MVRARRVENERANIGNTLSILSTRSFELMCALFVTSCCCVMLARGEEFNGVQNPTEEFAVGIKPTWAGAAILSDASQRGRHLQRWRDEGGADYQWYNVGGLVLGWRGLMGALNSSFLGGVFARFKEWLISLGNVLFVMSVAFGFAFLPRRLMLAASFAGIFFGPALAALGLQALGGVVFLAAYVPGLAVFCIWIGAFTTSKAAQKFGMWLGLDRDHDGDVDWHDLWHECLRRFSPALHEDVQKHNLRKPESQIRLINERLERLERLLLNKLGPLDDEQQQVYMPPLKAKGGGSAGLMV